MILEQIRMVSAQHFINEAPHLSKVAFFHYLSRPQYYGQAQQLRSLHINNSDCICQTLTIKNVHPVKGYVYL